MGQLGGAPAARTMRQGRTSWEEAGTPREGKDTERRGSTYASYHPLPSGAGSFSFAWFLGIRSFNWEGVNSHN